MKATPSFSGPAQGSVADIEDRLGHALRWTRQWTYQSQKFCKAFIQPLVLSSFLPQCDLECLHPVQSSDTLDSNAWKNTPPKDNFKQLTMSAALTFFPPVTLQRRETASAEVGPACDRSTGTAFKETVV